MKQIKYVDIETGIQNFSSEDTLQFTLSVCQSVRKAMEIDFFADIFSEDFYGICATNLYIVLSVCLSVML